MVGTDLERKVELMAVEGWKGQPGQGGGGEAGGKKMKEQRGRTSHINSCGSQSAQS